MALSILSKVKREMKRRHDAEFSMKPGLMASISGALLASVLVFAQSGKADTSREVNILENCEKIPSIFKDDFEDRSRKILFGVRGFWNDRDKIDSIMVLMDYSR